MGDRTNGFHSDQIGSLGSRHARKPRRGLQPASGKQDPPPRAHKARSTKGKWRLDRTPYKGDRKISFVSYHTRSISMNIARAEAWQLRKATDKEKGRLCRLRDGNHNQNPGP